MLRLTVEALDLGPDVRAVGLELVDPEAEEPVGGAEAAPLWSRALGALAGEEPCVLDFFAHLDRVREFCVNNDVRFRDSAAGGVVVTDSDPDVLGRLFERFESETFGARAGELAGEGDAALEGELRRRGLDAYHQAYPRYFFCAICELETGAMTVVSEKLWASEVARRLRAALKEFPVSVEMLM
ncbi:MAG: hypothetical protein KGL59_11560 [Acidobacteriota bacterium]|nr:hypothetical protein [Acidobacteriota bacterium]